MPESTRLRSGLGRVFIFGGPMEDEFNSPPKSLRDAFYRTAFERKAPFSDLLSRPEDYHEWHLITGYPDLLSFERDACHLARLVVLFSESAGAHAELGAYATDSELSRKILVVIDSKFRSVDHKNSFINLGPIRRLENARSKADDVLCVISPKSKTEFGEDDYDLICEAINERLASETAKTSKLSAASIKDRLLVLIELANLFHVLELPDALEALNHLGLGCSKEEIRGYFNLFHTLDICRLVERGNRRFLVSHKKDSERVVEFSGVHGNPFDPIKFKLLTWKRVSETQLLKSTYEMGCSQ